MSHTGGTLPAFIPKKSVNPWSQGWLIAAGDLPSFCSVKRLGVFLLPLDGMLVHRRSLPRNLLGFPIIRRYPFILLGGERQCESCVLPKNTTQCPRPGLESGLFAPGTSTLTIRPLCLPKSLSISTPPGCDTGPSQGYPQSIKFCAPIYNWVERGTMRVKCLSQQHNRDQGANEDYVRRACHQLLIFPFTQLGVKKCKESDAYSSRTLED